MRSLFTAFSVHNSLLGACWGWRAWIAIVVDDSSTFDEIVIQRLLYVYDLYVCFSTNINVVILLTGFLASQIIWIFLCSVLGPMRVVYEVFSCMSIWTYENKIKTESLIFKNYPKIPKVFLKMALTIEVWKSYVILYSF